LPKENYVIPVYIGEPDFLMYLRKRGESRLIPRKTLFKYASSASQAALLVDLHLEKFPELDYEIGPIQVVRKGVKFGPFEGTEINKSLLK
jgi:hypothetical protein